MPSLTERYISLEEALQRQSAPSVARGVIAAEIAALVVVVLSGGDGTLLPGTLPIGILFCLAGMLLYRRSKGWGRTLVWLGAYPLVAFCAWIWPWLGWLAFVIWGIIILITMVA